MRYYNGLTEWRNPHWYSQTRNAADSLKIYSRHFSTVEGNSTFYALPDSETVKRWEQSTPAGFRFCFKFPREISHDHALRHCASQVTEFLNCLQPLQHKLGVLWLQLSAGFSPQQLPVLQRFLASLPDDFDYGVEVRHPGFFSKDAGEQAFNRLLMERRVNRTLFDTRTLFANPTTDTPTQDALRKKPRVPLHVIATANQPMVRFIAPMQMELASTALDQWANKVSAWIDENRTPYLFFHTPDTTPSPSLAAEFSRRLQALRAEIPAIRLWPMQNQQETLF